MVRVELQIPGLGKNRPTLHHQATPSYNAPTKGVHDFSMVQFLFIVDLDKYNAKRGQWSFGDVGGVTGLHSLVPNPDVLEGFSNLQQH